MADHRSSTSRRSVLSGLLAGAALGVAGGSSAQATTGTDATGLGDFESGLDGWKTNGGNRLSRIHRSDAELGVRSGSYGMEVTVNGDAHPMIENKTRVADADLVSNPYLACHVLATLVSDTDSDLTFQFRLHHDGGDGLGSTKRGRGKGRGNSDERAGTPGKRRDKERQGRQSNEKPVLVEESPEMRVQTLQPAELAWDMSDISTEKREKAKRLEITWYPTDHPPQRGARGNANGFEYTGGVVFDDIRVTDDPDVVSQATFRRHWRQLLFEHGRHVETRPQSRTETTEEGVLVFESGTELSYTFRLLEDGSSTLTIDGTTYEFEGGLR